LEDLAIDGNNNLYVKNLDAIRKITPEGKVTTVVTHLSIFSSALAADRLGNLFSAGFGTMHRIDINGNITTYDISAIPDIIGSLTIDGQGNLYAETRGRGVQIYKI
jgi:sugar lactone lactonase YvrE